MIGDLKPYPTCVDSGADWIGPVPDRWQVRRLKTTVKSIIELDRSPVAPEKYVALEHVEGWTGKITTGDAAPVASQLKSFRRGDVLFGKLRPYLAKVSLARFDGRCVGEFLVLRPMKIDPAYLERTLRTRGFIDAVTTSTDGARMPRTEWAKIGALDIPFPPPEDQAAIVRYLDHIDSRIQRFIVAKERLIELLEEEKQAIIHRAVTRGLDPDVELKPTGVKWLQHVPVGWEVQPIGRLASVGNGSTPSRANPLYWTGGSYPWLNSSLVNNEFVDEAEQYVTDLALKECHLPRVPSGSVLVAITGQGKTRGKAAVLRLEATINQHIAFIKSLGRIDPAFLRLALTAAYRELRALSDDSGSTKGALTCGDLKRFRVPLPPATEQSTIVTQVGLDIDLIERTRSRAQRQVEHLREYQIRLISDVVTGKLDVREAAKSLPAESDLGEPILGESLVGATS